jgi:hypothetical protein
VAILSMHNPHGVVIALENADYFVMGLAFLAAAGAIPSSGRLERAVRWVFVVAGILAVGDLILLAALFGADLDVRDGVAAVSTNYLAPIVVERCSPSCSGGRAGSRPRNGADPWRA